MSKTNSTLGFATDDDLQRVVEPLDSYICATDRPKEALRRALAAVLSDLQATDWVASMQVALKSRVAGNGMNLAA